jgi:hypothetical protein
MMTSDYIVVVVKHTVCQSKGSKFKSQINHLSFVANGYQIRSILDLIWFHWNVNLKKDHGLHGN